MLPGDAWNHPAICSRRRYVPRPRGAVVGPEGVGTSLYTFLRLALDRIVCRAGRPPNEASQSIIATEAPVRPTLIIESPTLHVSVRLYRLFSAPPKTQDFSSAPPNK